MNDPGLIVCQDLLFDLTLTDEQRMNRETMQRFAAQEIRVLARTVDAGDSPAMDGYGVKIFEESSGQRLACDGCENLDVPLCVVYCWKGDDLTGILEQFLGK